jgi:hypothetical protein
MLSIERIASMMFHEEDSQTKEGYYEAASQIVLGHSRASFCRHGG